MANETHVKLINKGVEAWNHWRSNNPKVRPDLTEATFASLYCDGADLRGVNLSYATLIDSNFDGADFRRAKFTNTNFIGPILTNANLSNTNLGGTDLGSANLRGAKLRGAELHSTILDSASLHHVDFTGAHLIYVNLRGANLSGANFSEAEIGWTIFSSNDLSEVIGLDTMHHFGPSTIGVDTLSQSGGQIPKVFLRGCGLSDWQIEGAKLYRPELTNKELGDILYRIHDLRAQRPIQLSPLFISYTHKDGAFVDKIERRLAEDGIRFWRDIHHSTAGRLETQIDRAMRLNPTVLLVLSENSVGSDWVEHEARLARKLEKELGRDIICPVALDRSWKDCAWPERLREQIKEYHILDFSNWEDRDCFARMYRRLVEGLDLFYKKEGVNGLLS
jgi:hypothetical protein